MSFINERTYRLNAKERKAVAKYLSGIIPIRKAAQEMNCSHQKVYTICTAAMRKATNDTNIELGVLLKEI